MAKEEQQAAKLEKAEIENKETKKEEKNVEKEVREEKDRIPTPRNQGLPDFANEQQQQKSPDDSLNDLVQIPTIDRRQSRREETYYDTIDEDENDSTIRRRGRSEPATARKRNRKIKLGRIMPIDDSDNDIVS